MPEWIAIEQVIGAAAGVNDHGDIGTLLLVVDHDRLDDLIDCVAVCGAGVEALVAEEIATPTV